VYDSGTILIYDFSSCPAAAAAAATCLQTKSLASKNKPARERTAESFFFVSSHGEHFAAFASEAIRAAAHGLDLLRPWQLLLGSALVDFSILVYGSGSKRSVRAVFLCQLCG
jgi:hypothetical protein